MLKIGDEVVLREDVPLFGGTIKAGAKGRVTWSHKDHYENEVCNIRLDDGREIHGLDAGRVYVESRREHSFRFVGDPGDYERPAPGSKKISSCGDAL